MSIRVGSQAESSDSLKAALVAEYLARTERLAPLFPRHAVRSRPLPEDLRLAYESPQNLALELTKSILYEDADSIDITNLKSHDSLWNGRPQHIKSNFEECI
ncbi:hypothetical protein OBRU01_00897 [Operophtera brumata]|uniref:Uncharacterized protein n=1 Tax=Operophtera brumata TaxID=104452 RepID=A0A0L7LUW3_OPEBR|nr:hypothetical protein OBRU01_00897 [Operophtera brumata]